MPQFILIAYDAKDEGALERRMQVRQQHLDAIARYRDSGNILCGLALTGENGRMHGSTIVTSFPSRAEFDAWLAQEPFMIHKVWQDITVLNASLAPTFSHLIKS